LTHVTVKVTDLAKQGAPFEEVFLVDTGSIHCLAPSERLQAAGVKPDGKAVYELANGQPVEFEYGFVWLEFLGEKTISKTIFGPAGCEPLLGAVALESVGLIVDPNTRTLRKLPAIPLK
jgi:predicted aspartyl protease